MAGLFPEVVSMVSGLWDGWAERLEWCISIPVSVLKAHI